MLKFQMWKCKCENTKPENAKYKNKNASFTHVEPRVLINSGSCAENSNDKVTLHTFNSSHV